MCLLKARQSRRAKKALTKIPIKSGSYCKCHHCKFEGFVYGTPILDGKNSGVTAPWCPRCGKNDKLEQITLE